MLYLDSAVLVALHCEEATTPAVRRWIVKQREPLAVSDWVLTECVSAFGLKVRRNELNVTDAQLAIQSIEQLVEESIEVLPIAAAHYRQARQWLQ
jgi:predicted nucleic acid-binding protein